MMTDRKMRRKALEMLDAIRAVLADQLAATVELRRVLGPLAVGLSEALASAAREASGVSVVVNESLKDEVYDFEEGAAQAERNTAFAKKERE